MHRDHYPAPTASYAAELAFVTPERVQWSINTFKPNKAAGPDGLKPVVLQHLGPKMIARITQFYRTSFLMGYVPTTLCMSKVVFIPKAGKDKYDMPKAFRPISLTNCLFKVMERLVLNELECRKDQGNIFFFYYYYRTTHYRT